MAKESAKDKSSGRKSHRRPGSATQVPPEARADWLAAKGKESPLQHAGQAGDDIGLSNIETESNESVEELADEEQSVEAARLEGVEDAGDHPERPTHTHDEYGHPDDVPPRRRRNRAA